MSKAEDLAKNLYPLLETDKIGNNPYISYNTEQLAKQKGFVEGYHQAEKDLELTVDDIMKIDALLIDMWNRPSNEDKYQEVLKRFKDFKDGSKK